MGQHNTNICVNIPDSGGKAEIIPCQAYRRPVQSKDCEQSESGLVLENISQMNWMHQSWFQILARITCTHSQFYNDTQYFDLGISTNVSD